MRIIGVVPGAKLFGSEDLYADQYLFVNGYPKRISACGGTPIGILSSDGYVIERALELCDAFVFCGGARFYPYHFEVMDYAARSGKPVLGICLGCQILLDRSEEHDTKTLGLVHGETLAFPAGLTQEDGSPAPVPHMGWNSLNVKKPDDPLFRGIPAEARFYFVHSYYVKPDPSLVLATTDYGMEFCSAYGGNGLWAVQFHPEKSGRFGLAILRNFYDYCKGARDAR